MSHEEMPKISVAELRKQLPALLDQVNFLGKKFMVTKHGRPYAILQAIGGREGPASFTPRCPVRKSAV